MAGAAVSVCRKLNLEIKLNTIVTVSHFTYKENFPKIIKINLAEIDWLSFQIAISEGGGGEISTAFEVTTGVEYRVKYREIKKVLHIT